MNRQLKFRELLKSATSRRGKAAHRSPPAAEWRASADRYDVAKRLDHAFFRRVKSGENPGYPRFQSFGRYHSFTDPQGGYAIRDGRIHLSKIGDVKVTLRHPIEGRINTCTLVAKNGHYGAVFSCEVEAVPMVPPPAMMGGDLGIHHLLVTSDGACFDHPQSLWKAECTLKRLQRACLESTRGVEAEASGAATGQSP